MSLASFSYSYQCSIHLVSHGPPIAPHLLWWLLCWDTNLLNTISSFISPPNTTLSSGHLLSRRWTGMDSTWLHTVYIFLILFWDFHNCIYAYFSTGVACFILVETRDQEWFNLWNDNDLIYGIPNKICGFPACFASVMSMERKVTARETLPSLQETLECIVSFLQGH